MENSGVKANIAVVEDEAIIARDLRRVLEEDGYGVPVVVGTGEEAVENVIHNGIDLVLMDIMLPGEVDGVKAANQIQAESDIPIIYVTAFTDESILERAKTSGPYGYLVKPIDKRELMIAIEMTLYRHRTEKKLKESEERFRSLVETSSDFIWEVDENIIYTYASPRIHDILGYEPEGILGRSPFELMPHEEARRVSDIFRPITAAHMPFKNLENINAHKDGHLVTIETSGIPFFDATGKFRGYRGIDRDITERKNLEDKLRAAAITDELTGLFNRRGFFTLADQQCKLSDRTKRKLALLYLDLDGMKAINDELGHMRGDQALIDTANILGKSFRESDIIARMGGDEFAVLLSELSDTYNEMTAVNHLLTNIEIHNTQGGRDYKLLLSVGASCYDPAFPCSVYDLLNRADALMYENKKTKK